MNLAPSEFRALVRGVPVLVGRRRNTQAQRGTEQQRPPIDVTRVKIQSYIRRYHRDEAGDDLLREATDDVSDWRHQGRADALVGMLSTYFELDAEEPASDVIEMFRRTACTVGPHTIRTQRDVLMFGIDAHTLRMISTWAADFEDEDLPLVLSPVVLATESDLGEHRLGVIEYWRLREGRISPVDLLTSLRALPRLRRLLNRGENALQEEGLA